MSSKRGYSIGPGAGAAGGATEAKQDVGNASLASIDTKLTSPVSVTGPLTDAQLRATPVPVSASNLDVRDLVFATDKVDASGSSVSVSNFPATQPVSIAATVQVDVTDEPTRDLGKVDVASLDQYTPVAGRLPVDGSGVTQPVSGTLTANQGTSSANDWRVDLRRGLTIQFAAIAVAGNGDNQIVAADATRKIKVLSYVIVAAGAVNAKWRSATTDKSGAMALVANSGVSFGVGTPAGGHILETAVNEALNLNLSAAVSVAGHLSYFLEA
jgi:hypothetical protein